MRLPFVIYVGIDIYSDILISLSSESGSVPRPRPSPDIRLRMSPPRVPEGEESAGE